MLREAEENEGCKVNLLRRDAQDASPIDREVPVGPALPQRPLEGGEVRVPNPDAAEPELENLAPQFKFRAIPISNSRNLIQIFKFPVSPKFSNSLGI